MCKSTIQSGNFFDSCHKILIDNDVRQTDTVVRIVFPHTESPKSSRFNENLKSHLSHITNTFSCSKYVKNYCVQLLHFMSTTFYDAGINTGNYIGTYIIS